MPAASFMDGTHVCLCDEPLHIWSINRPANCSGCDSEDACGGGSFGTSRSVRGLVVAKGDGTEQTECVCQCTSLFAGLSCNTSLTKLLPVSPGVGVGITFGTVATIGIGMACLLSRSDGLVRANRAATQRMLSIELVDWVLDWTTFVLAFYETDLQFHNDPDEVLRTLLLTLCALSTAAWVIEIILFCTIPETFVRLALCVNVVHILLEDGSQVMLYSIAAAGNANHNADDSTLKLIIVVAAGLQSLVFFLVKTYELFNVRRLWLAGGDPRLSTTGGAGAELAVGVGRRTGVGGVGLDWSNWAQTVSSEEDARAFFDRRQLRSEGGAKLCIVSMVKVENAQALSNFQSSNSFEINPLQAHGRHCDTLLFHGCKPESVANIQATGLLLERAADGMLGTGLYGAPDPRKAFNYCGRSEDKFMFICRFRLDARAKHAGPSTQHRNKVFDEFCVYNERHVAVLWMLKVEVAAHMAV